MRHPASEQLHQSEERLQAVIDSAPVAILEVDLDARVIRWNPAAQQVFGWLEEEILGQDVPIVPPSKQAEFLDVLKTVRAGRVYGPHETFRQRKDGTLVDVQICAAPVRDRRGNVVSHMVVFTDITARKEHEAELRRLNTELEGRLADLAASRARLVDAGDAERRRLERNLHDGAQQRLVTLALQLNLARAELDRRPESADATLAAAQEELRHALAELREIARGLHPAVLSDHGLARAVEALARRVPVDVAVEEVPAERLPEPVEVAIYYLVAEALTNVVKYAGAGAARVRVAQREGGVDVLVSDDGAGGATFDGGSGLRGLVDRVAAVGGELHVASPPGAGTTISAEIPLAGVSPPA